MNSQTSLHATPNAMEAEIVDLLDRWFEAYKDGDLATCVDLYTVDSTILNAFGSDASGRQEVEAVHKEWYAASNPLEKTYELIDFGGSEHCCYALAKFEGSGRGPDGAEHSHTGDLLCVFKRTTSGELRLHVTSLHDRS